MLPTPHPRDSQHGSRTYLIVTSSIFTIFYVAFDATGKSFGLLTISQHSGLCFQSFIIFIKKRHITPKCREVGDRAGNHVLAIFLLSMFFFFFFLNLVNMSSRPFFGHFLPRSQNGGGGGKE